MVIYIGGLSVALLEVVQLHHLQHIVVYGGDYWEDYCLAHFKNNKEMNLRFR